MIGGYEQLWKAIIRPPRAEYTVQDLGTSPFPRPQGFQKALHQNRTQGYLNPQQTGLRPPMQPLRALQPSLQGSSLCNLPPRQRQLQNLGVPFRLFSQRIVHYLLSRDITVFTFDFAGCGLSEGPYISLGYYERDDVDFVFKYLRQLGTVSSIGIWGRSMGAVTALMYADTNH